MFMMVEINNVSLFFADSEKHRKGNSMNSVNLPRNDPASFIPDHTSLPVLIGGNGLSPNITSHATLPKEIQFTEDGLVSVIAYSILFVIAAVGNLTVFITLFRG